MNNEENNVIRYLMNEMDPSQEVLMERAMMEDDDLLIEVESLRQTMRRLNDLPEKEPSKELTDAVLEQAAEQKTKWYHLPTIPNEVYKYAAVLLLGIGLSSGFWLMMDADESSSDLADNASVELPASFQTASTDQSGVEPWVDNNNVLYFQDQFNANSSAYQSIIEASMQKLTPLQGPPVPTFRSRNLQMTGAQ